nr:hypothetical protein [Tanacetum cinerariifolium]
MLCDALILALPEGTDDFVVYYDASNQGFGCVLMQRNKVIAYASRQLKIHEKNYTTYDLELGVVRRWIELFNDYDCEFRCHPGQANVVADALSRKEWMKPRRARAMSMTIHSSIKAKILEAQSESFKDVNTQAEVMQGLDKQFERKEDGRLYFVVRIWVPAYSNLRALIMNEAHATKYYVHHRSDKMYYDLRDLYWWPRMKKDIALHRTGRDLVIVDRLTKSAHFLAIREDYKMERLARLYINEIIARQGVPVSSWQSFHFTILAIDTKSIRNATGFDNRDTHLPLVEFSYNNSYHASVKCAPFEALYGRKYRTPVTWAEVGESKLIGPDIVQETTGKIVKIKERLKAARDRQKSYADNRRKPLEFSVGDKYYSKCRPRKV